MFYIREAVEEYFHRNGMPDVTVQLKDASRSALASLARTQIYREHLSDESYFGLLFKHLDLSPSAFKAKILGVELQQRGPVSRAVGKIIQFGLNCGDVLKKLLQLRRI